MTTRDNHIINLIKTRIKEKEPSAEIILFGSRARGNAHSDSDWDILILLNIPSVSREEEKGFRDEIFDIELETGEPISTFVFSKQEWETKYIYTPFYINIKKRRQGYKMTGTLQDYITYRIEKAKETLIDAKVLANNNRWNACMSRLYYSCFYIVSALLSANKIQAKTHNGVKTKFFHEFIKSQKVDKKYGKLYSHLFDWRQESDYADFIDFDKDTVTPLIKQVEEFIEIINELI